MQNTLTAIVAVVALTAAACGGDPDSQSNADESARSSSDATTAPARPASNETDVAGTAATTTTAVGSTATLADETAVAVVEPATTVVLVPDPTMTLRAEAADRISDRLSADAPAGVTVDEIACVAEMSAAALDTDRLNAAVAALDAPSVSLLPAALVTPAEQDRLLDSVVGCVPWTQLLIGLMLTADTPLEMQACAEATAADNDTDRTAAEFLLFGGDLIAAYDLLPSECVPAVEPAAGADQPVSAAARMTVAQLASAGVSADSAACVAAQIDEIFATLDPGADAGDASGPDIVAAMLGCLTPDELALLDADGSIEG